MVSVCWAGVGAFKMYDFGSAALSMSEFTELAESRFLDCESSRVTQGAFDPICCGFTGYVHNNKTN